MLYIYIYIYIRCMLYIYKYPEGRQKKILRRFATCVLANVDLYGKLV